MSTYSVSDAVGITLHELRAPLTTIRNAIHLLQHFHACDQYHTELTMLMNEVTLVWVDLDRLLEYHAGYYQLAEGAEISIGIVAYTQQALSTLVDVELQLIRRTQKLQIIVPTILLPCRQTSKPEFQPILDLAFSGFDTWQGTLEPLLRQSLRPRLQRLIATSSLA